MHFYIMMSSSPCFIGWTLKVRIWSPLKAFKHRIHSFVIIILHKKIVLGILRSAEVVRKIPNGIQIFHTAKQQGWFKIKDDSSELSNCDQTHQPIMVAVQNRCYFSHKKQIINSSCWQAHYPYLSTQMLFESQIITTSLKTAYGKVLLISWAS